jgi:phosphatidylserine decarboxylase
MNFAREGYVFMAAAAAMAAGTLAVALARRSWGLWLVAFTFGILTLWVAYFFRDPERQGDRGDRLVVSPADGRVVTITEVDEPAFLHGRAKRVSVFMNIFNVHVNRYPVSGTIAYVHYNPGLFLNAAHDKASLENEQRSVGIVSAGSRSRILVRQIAGLIARRIVTYGREGDDVSQGARMGIIRFGSRVDVFMPLDAAVRVTAGQAVEAGVTVLADLAT